EIGPGATLLTPEGVLAERAVLRLQVFLPERRRLDDMAVGVERYEVLGRHRGLPHCSAETGPQHCRRSLADFLDCQRGQSSALLVDAVRSQTARRRPHGKQEVPCRIEAERAGHSLGWYVPSRRQMPRRGIDSEGGDIAAVSRAVADIEKPSRGRQVNLRASGTLAVTGRQTRNRLHGRGGAVCAVEPVCGDTATLLVREEDDVETEVMDVVAGSDEIPLLNTMWRIRAQPTGLSVEAVLQDHIGTGIIFRRLQHIVLDAGDMRHKGEAVGRIGRDRMRPYCGFLRVNGSSPNGAVRCDRIHRGIAPL